MTDTPIWLMDVDGVLNLYGRPGLPGPELRSFRSSNGFEMLYRMSLIERLAKLHTDGRIEIQWLTTWEDLADKLLADDFGLPRGLEVAGRSSFDSDGPHWWWKQNAVSRLYDDGHRLIWTDDDIAQLKTSPARDWLDSADERRLIWDSPEPDIGITDEFLDRVEAWL